MTGLVRGCVCVWGGAHDSVWVCEWMSAQNLQRLLGLRSYNTAWYCLHKLRRAMVRPGRERLSGIVERAMSAKNTFRTT